MRIHKQQSGFAILELVLVVVIVAAIVVVGLWVYNKNQSDNSTASNTASTSKTQSPVAHNISTAPQINSTSDLDRALVTLNQNNPATSNNSDQRQLDSQTSF